MSILILPFGLSTNVFAKEQDKYIGVVSLESQGSEQVLGYGKAIDSAGLIVAKNDKDKKDKKDKKEK